MDAFMAELAHFINNSKTTDPTIICLSLVHTFVQFVISDDNPNNKEISKEDRKKRALEMLNVVLKSHEEKLEFICEPPCLCQDF